MKKCMFLMVIVAMLIGICLPISASSASTDSLKFNEEYGFSYEETVDSDGRIFRSYQKQSGGNAIIARTSTNSSNEVSDEYIKSVLSSLGMGDVFIDKLTDEQLEEYKNAKNINSVTTYSKTDAEGNVTVVDEETALEATSAGGNSRVAPLPEDFGDGGDQEYVFDETGTFEDTYLRITYTVSELNGGVFKFSLDSTYLHMPQNRNYDSLGACVQNFTINNTTRSGWYSYTKNEHNYLLGDFSSTTIETNFTSADFTTIYSGNWSGSAVVVNLPNNVYTSADLDGNNATEPTVISAIMYEDYVIHYEFKASPNDINTSGSYYTYATYDHMEIGSSGSLSITLNGIIANIGLSDAMYKHTRTIELGSKIYYTP